ncbi:glycosyltransferase [Pedobacter sp. HMF7647]|uniref:Glycosyltransferase n=1 Tax=Hufsiella arboris TaxID=2695275 RepID=A0A7K1Y7F0_9SPHI|nr:glycosyltransferase family 2 protein [Hufsiella arboris]MXV50493.1 glycosyltransferase [Hufsiella arboris]
MSEFPKVAVVILNWNGKLLLEKYLSSVYNSTYQNLEIYVGDNASTDDSLEFVKENFPGIKILVNDKNYGYAGGYNHILEHIESDYFVLLNSDVEVTPGWIEPVIKVMVTDPSIAAAQPKIKAFHEKGSFEYAGAAGGYIDRYGYPFCRGRIFDYVEKDDGQYDDDREIFWASGAAFFIRKSCWKEVKGFDEVFFSHMEEIDICWRLKNLGYKIMYCAQSTVYHVGAGTLNTGSPFKTYLNFRNSLMMLKKNLPPFKATRIIIIRHFLDLITIGRFLSIGQFANARSVSKAHWYFLRNVRKKNIPVKGGQTLTGFYPGSIVYDYFVKGIKKFNQLTFK